MASLSNLPAGVTDAMIDAQCAAGETVTCTACARESDYESPTIVEVSATRYPGQALYFCDAVCRSRHIYEQTDTGTGRAALKRFVAALHLLMDEDVAVYAPALKQFECDEVQYSNYPTREYVEIQTFRQQAMAFLEVLSPEGVKWATEAQDAAGEFAAGKDFSAPLALVSKKTMEVAHA